jgi:hypothetical protein
LEALALRGCNRANFNFNFIFIDVTVLYEKHMSKGSMKKHERIWMEDMVS